MIQEGADILDIGGYSSRPGAHEVSEQEELTRVIHGIQAIRQINDSILISVDTFRSTVAKAAVNEGADLINDISGGQADTRMFETCALLDVPYILMHMRGNPQNMMEKTHYQDLIGEMKEYFDQRIRLAKEAGVKDIILDPGFGFSKTQDQNYELLHKLHEFHDFGLTLLAGISRKSMIYNKLDTTATESLNGTTVLNTLALQQGAGILRVHDVREAVETVKLVEAVNLL